MNVLMITCHDLGDFLDPYGYNIKTPELSMLAADGVLFKHHFSTSTVCSPARGAIMTGCDPHVNGLMGLVHRGWSLDTVRCKTIPTLLAENGYDTHLFGFQHEHYNPHVLGYKHIHQENGFHCKRVCDSFNEWLDNNQNNGMHFFASLGFSDVHRVGLMPSSFKQPDYYEPVGRNSVEIPSYMPDLPEIRKDFTEFYANIRHMDSCVGTVIKKLKEKNLYDNTLIIFTTDHGASFIHSKATLYDGGTKVAMIMSCPGTRKGLRTKGLSSHVDIMPTICDILDIQPPNGIQGMSLLPLITGDKEIVRDAVYSEKNMTNYFDPQRSIRTKDYKYICKGVSSCILDFLIPEIELSRWNPVRNPEIWKFYDLNRTTEEFYDLNDDPAEMNNLIDDPVYTQSLQVLRQVLNKQMYNMNDPFRNFYAGYGLQKNGYSQLINARLSKNSKL